MAFQILLLLLQGQLFFQCDRDPAISGGRSDGVPGPRSGHLTRASTNRDAIPDNSVKPYGGSYGTGSKSMEEGGSQIEYDREDREIHAIFERELAKNGAPCRMKAFIPWCTGEVGPTSERDT